MPKKPTTTSATTEVSSGLIEKELSVRTASKMERLIRMLRLDGGATIFAISSALGWQPRTTRAAATSLRKASDTVETAKPGVNGPRLIYQFARRSDADVTANISAEARQ